MKSNIRIPLDAVEDFAKICAYLVKEGVLFEAVISDGSWLITFTGSF